jgi:MutL protein
LDTDGASKHKVESILSADIGSLWTRVALLDVVSGEYRFVARAAAPTSAELPFGDITVGLYNAIAELERLTGRQIVEEGHLIIPQLPSGNGVDAFIAASSAAPAMRIVLLALNRDITARSALHAAESIYTNVLDLLTVDEHLAAGEKPLLEGEWLARQVQRLVALQPDAALIVGGVDGGPVAPLLKLADAVAQAAKERASLEQSVNATPSRLPVIFAGNQSARGKIAARLDETTDLRLTENVRPHLDRERLAGAQEQLDSLYLQKQLTATPGYPRLASWTENIIPTALAEGIITRYIATQYHRDVLIADVGASSVSGFLTNDAAANANPRAAERAFYRVVKGDFGLAYGLPNLLREVGAAAVLRWLPFSISENELVEWALNRLLRPLSLAAEERDLQIEHAFAREALRYIAQRMREQANPPARLAYDLLIGTGGLLANVPRPQMAAMLLLDGLEPEGLPAGSVELALDNTMLLPHIGTSATVNPAAAAYVFDRDSLLWLGTAIVPLAVVANPLPNQPAVTITLEYADGGNPLKAEVPYGEIRVVSLRPDQRAQLTVQPGRDFRVGNGERGKLVRTMGEEVKGGYVGLIIDARGRPLRLPSDEAARFATLQRWQEAIGVVAVEGQARPLPSPVSSQPDLPPLATRIPLSPTHDIEAEAAPPTSASLWHERGSESSARDVAAEAAPPAPAAAELAAPTTEEAPTTAPASNDESLPPWLMADELADVAPPAPAPQPEQAVAATTNNQQALLVAPPVPQPQQEQANVTMPPWLHGEQTDDQPPARPGEMSIPPWLRGADEDERSKTR